MPTKAVAATVMVTPPRRERRRGGRRSGGGTKFGVGRSLSPASTATSPPASWAGGCSTGCIAAAEGPSAALAALALARRRRPIIWSMASAAFVSLARIFWTRLARGKFDKSIQKCQSASARAGPVQVDGQTVTDSPCPRLGLRPSGRGDRRGERSIEHACQTSAVLAKSPARRSALSSPSARFSLAASCMSGCGRTSGEDLLTRLPSGPECHLAYREDFRKLGVHFDTTAGNKSPSKRTNGASPLRFPGHAGCGFLWQRGR